MLSISEENTASAYICSVFSFFKRNGDKRLWLLFLDLLLEWWYVGGHSSSCIDSCASCNTSRKKADIDSWIIRLAEA